MFSSFNNRKKTAVLIIAVITLKSLSILSMKYAALAPGMNKLAFILLVLVFATIRADLWQKLLESRPISQIYPFNALVQPIILVYSALLFNEAIMPHHIIGTLFMMAGIYTISGKL